MLVLESEDKVSHFPMNQILLFGICTQNRSMEL